MEKCQLCGQESQGGSVFEYSCCKYNCPFCGIYSIDKYLLEDMSSRVKQDFLSKAKFMALERRLRGQCFQDYFIHNMTPDKIAAYSKNAAPGGFINYEDFIKDFPANHEIPDRALRNIGRAYRLSKCEFGGEIEIELESPPAKGQYPGLMLFVEDSNAQVGLLHWLEKRGYIEQDSNDSGHVRISLMPEGWSRINEVEQKEPDSKQIFVAMWFAPEMESIYKEGIALGIEDVGKGYKPRRIDEKETVNKICDEIIVEIRRSRAVVADFTGQRGGVYYEAGFAIGLGIPVIWTVHEDEIKLLHFDTNHYAHITYKTPAELRKKLANRILALGI